MSAILKDQEPVFRAMTEADLDQVMEVERSGYPHPWTRGIFRDCLRVGYLCEVLEIDRVLHGHGIMSAGAGEAHILNLCVRYASQRQGLGRRMLEHLLGAAARLHARTVLLEVRPSNTPAVALYRAAGFNEVGVRRNYYPARSGREDALIMARSV